MDKHGFAAIADPKSCGPDAIPARCPKPEADSVGVATQAFRAPR
jgi:hypothetical protein